MTTGISALDRQLSGSIPAGSIVHLAADPASQLGLLLRELTTTRGALRLTTVRSAEAISDALDRGPEPTGTPTIRDVGGDAPLDTASSLVRDLPEGANLIIDMADVFEHNESARYQKFLNGLQTRMVNTYGLIVLHGLKGESVSDSRDPTEHVVDVVFDLSTKIGDSEIVDRLAIPEFYGGRVLDGTIKLQLVEHTSVDTSRDIV